MKTIIIHRSLPDSIPEFPQISTVPDSAVTRDWRPVFLPDSGSPWTGRLLPAYRISRLGKNIPERFATRYFDALTLAVIAFPAPGTIPPALALTVDGAIALGKWIEIPTQTLETDAVHTIRHAGVTTTFSDSSISIYRAIHILSRCMTLKTGDIIIPASEGTMLPLDIDTEVTADLDNTRALEYRVK